MQLAQVCLFGGGSPSFDGSFQGMRRVQLDADSWVDHLPGWVAGHEEIFATLRDGMSWREGERTMYDRVVAVPRLYGRIPADGAGHPLLAELRDALASHYQGPFPHLSCNYYRDGADSVAPHADHIPPEHRADPLPIVSVGAPRPFTLKPKSGGRSTVFRLGWGDLIVLGGQVHVSWLHGVPKLAHAEPRISVMFRRGYDPG